MDARSTRTCRCLPAVLTGCLLMLLVTPIDAQVRRRDTVTLTSKQILSNVAVLKEDCREIQVDSTGDGVANKTVPQSEVLRVTYGDAPAAFRSALALFDLGTQYDKALEQFKVAGKATGVRGWLKDYVAYYSAECIRLQDGSTAEVLTTAVEEYRKTLARSPNGPLRDGTLYGFGQALMKQGKTDEARKQFERLERVGLKETFKVGAQLGIADILVQQKEPAKAVKQYDLVVRKGRKGAGGFYEQAVVGKTQTMIQLKQFDAAVAFLKGIVKKSRSTSLLTQAYVGLGDCYYQKAQGLKDKKEARNVTKEALFSYLRVEVLYAQNPELLAKSLYFAGKCFQGLDQDERAMEKFAQLRRKFPNSPYVKMIR